LSASKMTVIVKYQGTPVKSLQALRREAKENGTVIKVIKNRLVIKALSQLEQFKSVDASPLEGMLAYAFNDSDEVAAASSLANFAKTNQTLEFVGAITPEGNWLSSEQVSKLAELPSKPALIASVVALLGTPIRSVIAAASTGLPNLLSALESSAAKE
ncbi:MAG: 50S ribosomal protein L10, partial [Candidatus Saccharimonadales bacterium]